MFLEYYLDPYYMLIDNEKDLKNFLMLPNPLDFILVFDIIIFFLLIFIT